LGLKEEGEALAKLALEEEVKKGQLRSLYTRAMSRPLADIEAYIKYQTTRVYGFKFGEELLRILQRYAQTPENFREVLRYAIMLYEYLKNKPFVDLKPRIEKVIEKSCSRYGFKGVRISVDREGNPKVEVILPHFHGSKPDFANELRRQILREVPNISKYEFLVWIKNERR
jgi:hypothetical protein